MFVVIALGAGPAEACKVPVFRYALERWEADDFRVVIVYRGEERKAEVEVLVAPLRKAGAANVRVEVVDAAALTEAQVWQFGDLNGVGTEPVLRLHFPPQSGIEEAFWEGVLTKENVALVRDSPAREAVADLLVGGASAVWLYVSDGEVAGETKLRDELVEVAGGMALPDGVLRASELLSGGVDATGQSVEMDDVLRTDVPFRIDFPVVPVRRGDPAEAVFVAMLLNGRGGVPSAGEAFVIPVFGRGRMIEALPESLVDASRLERACAYLCGECSCQVKDENPGSDLLLAVDWKARLRTDIALVERQLEALPAVMKPETVTFGAANPPEAMITESAAMPWYLGGGLVFCLALGALAWTRRARRMP